MPLRTQSGNLGGRRTRRISGLAAAIKSYSQMDRASTQQIDVTDGIGSALVMPGHKRRPGIAVVPDYDAGLPPIPACPGELNQVRAHLIDNALDAMNGAGTLTLAARAGDEHIVVEAGDTGPGMAPQVASRAFDAFSATKDAGTGTGPGPDIAPAHRRRAPRRPDHHRLPAGEHRAAGPPPHPGATAQRPAGPYPN